MDCPRRICNNEDEGVINMDFVVGLLSFLGEVISAWTTAAWSYFQEKLDNN
jgi:hypothetical protein